MMSIAKFLLTIGGNMMKQNIGAYDIAIFRVILKNARSCHDRHFK